MHIAFTTLKKNMKIFWLQICSADQRHFMAGGEKSWFLYIDLKTITLTVGSAKR